MESESGVDQGIDLETGDLSHLSFSNLDTDTSTTTDGNLLSGLAADSLTDDISTTSVLTILPQDASNYPRGLTPIEQSHYGVQNISVNGVNGSLQTTAQTGYELTELGVADGIDTSCKLVTDSNNILLGVGNSNTHQPHQVLSLSSSTLSHDNSITFTTAGQQYVNNHVNNSSGLLRLGEYNHHDSAFLNIGNKLPEFKTFDHRAQTTIQSAGTYLTSATKSHLQQSAHYQPRNTINILKQQSRPNVVHLRTSQIFNQQQQNNLNEELQQHRSHQLQIQQQQLQQHQQLKALQLENVVTLRQGSVIAARQVQSMPQPVQAQQLASGNTNTASFSVRLPITTPLGKGLHLQLVAKGNTPLTLINNNSVSYQQNQGNTDVNHFLRCTNNTQIPAQTSNTERGIVLLRDKITGKSYVLPTAATSTPLVHIPNDGISSTQPTHHPNHQMIRIERDTTPCLTPIDVVGNSDALYGDLGISEPQPVIDVNEFLNIPTKDIQQSEGDSTGNKNELLQNFCNDSGSFVSNTQMNTVDNNSHISNSPASTNECNLDSSVKEVIVPSPQSIFDDNNVNFINGNNSSVFVGKPSDELNLKPLLDSKIKSSNINCSGDKNNVVESDNKNYKKEVTLWDNKDVQAKKIKNSPNKSKTVTGEDLIKMMAVKKCDRKQNQKKSDTCKVKTSDNSPQLSKAARNFDNPNNIDNKKITCITSSTSEQVLQNEDGNPSKDSSLDGNELEVSGNNDNGEMDSSIIETEQRIASIVPESMKDFVRDIFEDEDALDKEYIQEIMDDTATTVMEVKTGEDSSSALSPGEIAKHALQKLADMRVDELKGIDVKSKLLPAVTVLVDKSQVVSLDGQRKWKCNICPKMYSTKHNLVTHILGHCEIKPHCCVLCGKLFKQPSHLHTHMLTHKQVKDHVCKVCGRGFTQPSHLKRHSAIHMEQRPHICDICDKGFAYPSELRTHKLRHTAIERIECEKCNSVFDTLKKLNQHTASNHRNTEDLTCKECGKVFAYPSQLRDHMMKHNGTRPYMCTECGMEFMKEHHVKAHLFTHTGQRPFICKLCNRTFNQKANLQRHMLIHEESKRYKCDQCNREFSQPQVLKSHLLTHSSEKPFKCSECGKGFSRQHNLNGHMALHQGNKKYVCFCGAAFTLKGNLNRHRKNKHNMSPSAEEEEGTAAEEEHYQQQEGISLSAEEMAAETAAKILNMMSAKRIPTPPSLAFQDNYENLKEFEQVNGLVENEESSNSVPISYYNIMTQDNRMDNDVGIVFLRDNEMLMNDESSQFSFKDDGSPVPKKKRKSVPSKIISKEESSISGTIDGANENNYVEEAELHNILNRDLITSSEIIKKPEVSYIKTIVTPTNKTTSTPVKRKQLKPKCLPLSPGKNINPSTSKDTFDSIQIKSHIEVISGASTASVVTASSTRRKQKAVAKANVSEPVEVVDEAEQEWQGTDSRSGMEQMSLTHKIDIKESTMNTSSHNIKKLTFDSMLQNSDKQ